MENAIIHLKPAEWEIYKTIRLESLKEDPQAFGGTYAESLEYSDEKWQERPSDKNTMIFVAKDGATPIGLIGVHMEEKEGENVAHLWGMYVNNKYRGIGLGKKLMLTALQAIENIKNVKKAKLMVACEPTPAQMLYTSLGFTITGTTEYILGDGKTHKLYIMEKGL